MAKTAMKIKQQRNIPQENIIVAESAAVRMRI